MPDIVATRPAAGAPIETAWGQQVQDMLEGIQFGSGVAVSYASGNGNVVVTFPRAYATPPLVIAQCQSAANFLQVSSNNPSTTSVTIYIKDVRDAASSSGSTFIQWLAIGTLATPG